MFIVWKVDFYHGNVENQSDKYGSWSIIKFQSIIDSLNFIVIFKIMNEIYLLIIKSLDLIINKI